MATTGRTENVKDNNNGQLETPSKVSTAVFSDGGQGAARVGNDSDPNPYGVRK